MFLSLKTQKDHTAVEEGPTAFLQSTNKKQTNPQQRSLQTSLLRCLTSPPAWDLPEEDAVDVAADDDPAPSRCKDRVLACCRSDMLSTSSRC